LIVNPRTACLVGKEIRKNLFHLKAET
jgi:hypothetical protein